MGTAKRDLSGVFDAELKRKRGRPAAVIDQVFHLNRKGMTFVSDMYLPEWTEVGVEMRVPGLGPRKELAITCRAVVVQCRQCQPRQSFEVVLLFLDLPKRSEARLDGMPAMTAASSIFISR